MDIQTAIKRRDQIKVDIGIMENKRATILTDLKAKFGTDDIQTLISIRNSKENELASAKAEQTKIEGELDTIFAGA
ncbi:MAG: hypothetical protein HUK12_00095 [Muribaculaceae bacterium]|nr:hypothetical protein [Bacilli bacterium]MCF0203709.1 hypothetical protein [Muribaculaceae bacterium]